MTNHTPHGQVPEALRLADYLDDLFDADGEPKQAAAELRRLHAYCQELESHLILDCMTHVQNPAEIEHVAGDVSKNGAELNMSAQQPAPATQQEAQEPVAWRELCRRLYVELFYCDQQLTSGKRPKWQQGKTVRDVLADAKAALDAAHQPSPAAQGDADLTDSWSAIYAARVAQEGKK